MSLPEFMTAIEIREPGDPEVLVPVQRPLPQVGPNEVLVRVTAAGVNRADTLQRKGKYPPPPGASDIPGLEVAGEVVALGAQPQSPSGAPPLANAAARELSSAASLRAQSIAPGGLTAAPAGAAPVAIGPLMQPHALAPLQIGSKVCALLAGGGYAEYVAVPAPQCLPIPADVTLQDAAGIPETFFTVYFNVFMRSGLKPGETLLVHGGASGIGTTAIMLGKAINAKVIVTAGSEDKCRACLDLGADHAINYRQEDFAAAVNKLTDKRGAQVILDMVGGEYIQRDITAAAVDGRISVIATQGGIKSEINLLNLIAKRVSLTGSGLRTQSVEEKGKIASALLTNVWPLFSSKRLQPLIYARFPLAEARRAHELMEADTHIGKIILLC